MPHSTEPGSGKDQRDVCEEVRQRGQSSIPDRDRRSTKTLFTPGVARMRSAISALTFCGRFSASPTPFTPVSSNRTRSIAQPAGCVDNAEGGLRRDEHTVSRALD